MSDFELYGEYSLINDLTQNMKNINLNSQIKQKGNNELAIYYFRLGNIDDAIKYANLSAQNNDAQGLYLLAFFKYTKGNLKNVQLKHIKKLLEKSAELGNLSAKQRLDELFPNKK